MTNLDLKAPPEILISGRIYLKNGEGHLVPKELVKEEHLLEDQLVRKIIGFAEDLSAQIDRFKGHTADDIGAFEALLAEKYGAPKRRGKKGNVTFFSYDGLLKVEVRLTDNLVFGAELQTAKLLIDECIGEWSADANAPIRLLVNKAFQVDQQGKINRNAILGLRNVEIDDDRWRRAMEAITASIRVIGTKTYFRFFRRGTVDCAWEPITVDLAAAEAPEAPRPAEE
jgi:hypothetical protein